jgi:hypothetical protein
LLSRLQTRITDHAPHYRFQTSIANPDPRSKLWARIAEHISNYRLRARIAKRAHRYRLHTLTADRVSRSELHISIVCHFLHYISFIVSAAAACHAAATDHVAQKPRPVFIMELIYVSRTAFVSKGQQELTQGGTDVTEAAPYPQFTQFCCATTGVR